MRVRLAQMPSAGVLAAALVAAAVLAFGVSFAAGRLLSEPAGSTGGQSSAAAELRLADASRVASVRPPAVAPSIPAIEGLSKAAPLPALRPPPARPVARPPQSEPPVPTEPAVTSAYVLEETVSEPEPTVPVAVTRPARRPDPPRKRKRERRKPPVVVIVGEG